MEDLAVQKRSTLTDEDVVGLLRELMEDLRWFFC